MTAPRLSVVTRWSATTLLAALVLTAGAGGTGCGLGERAPGNGGAAISGGAACGARRELCNGVDDDCDGIIDERADSNCELAHAASSCTYGLCLVEQCARGYYDCNELAADGCESAAACSSCAGECGAAGAAGRPREQSAAPGIASNTVHTPATQRDQDAGDEPPDGVEQDAGPRCTPERCDGQDNDCDQRVDEAGSCACAEAEPTGQGNACDRCVCDNCPEALAACTGTADDTWNELCGDVLRCFGTSVQAGLCTGPDSDCYQSGDGPCADEFRSAFTRGWLCTADPVRTPCGALTQVRLACYRTKCAGVCKS